MPKFIITEERRDIYTCTIEAESLEHAKKLYDQDAIEIFGDQWEQDCGAGCELQSIIELDEDGQTKCTHIYEDGERLVDSF